jgi:hypothetical protein
MQCSAEFKSLLNEVERAVAHRKRIGNMKGSDIDLDWRHVGGVRAMIYNQKVALLDQIRERSAKSRIADIVLSFTYSSRNKQ